MVELSVENGPDAGKTAILTAPDGVIGRSETCCLPLSDGSVSREHACIRVDGTELRIADLGSRHGTQLNGELITSEQPLTDGDEIKIGDTVITVRQHTDAHEVTVDEQLRERLCSNEISSLVEEIRSEIMRSRAASPTADRQNDELDRVHVELELDRVLDQWEYRLPPDVPRESLRQEVLDDMSFYGPISPYVRLPAFEEIMVNGPPTVLVAANGTIRKTKARFRDEDHLTRIIGRIVARTGRRLDQASPTVDARLPDGSRMNAVVKPIALDGPYLTIRKFPERRKTIEDLLEAGTLGERMAEFLRRAVETKRNILVSGGTASGKTTFLNVLSEFINPGERIVTIEDTAELRLSERDNLVRLECRPPNIEGQGQIDIHHLVVNALRMRPDRIIVGESRSYEMLDVLQAMNTGHEGSLTTVHANSPSDALLRAEGMVLRAGELPSHVVRDMIASAIHFVVQLVRSGDGSRRVVQITEVTGIEGERFSQQDIFRFDRDTGRFVATGNRPDGGGSEFEPELFRPDA